MRKYEPTDKDALRPPAIERYINNSVGDSHHKDEVVILFFRLSDFSQNEQ